ncbi:hypothetical protein [Roseibium sp.]|uniref:hypothetical protein n=1 Tax=Roseibium sp. TaxID=1936156 RepID=UPI003B5121CC
MATTIERPQSAQVVAHATEYPADRDGDGTGYDRRSKRNDAERHDSETDTGYSTDEPAVFIDAHHLENHALDGVAAYRAAALQALEPRIDHGPVHPLRGAQEGIGPDNIRHAYEDHGEADEWHEINVAT